MQRIEISNNNFKNFVTENVVQQAKWYFCLEICLTISYNSSHNHIFQLFHIYPAIGSQSLEKAGMLSKPSITRLLIHAPLTEITINNPLNSLSTGEE